MINARLLTIKEENKQPVILLSGIDLLKAGFSVGDIVRISFSENTVTIKKDKNTKTLQSMERINPSIKKLCKDFDLDIAG